MATCKITTVCDQQGKRINATFQVEVSDGKTSVIIRSRGGTKGSANGQNTDYNLGVELIFGRLKAKDCKLEDAVLDTKYTKAQGLSHEDRRLDVGKFPIALSSENLSKLTKDQARDAFESAKGYIVHRVDCKNVFELPRDSIARIREILDEYE